MCRLLKLFKEIGLECMESIRETQTRLTHLGLTEHLLRTHTALHMLEDEGKHSHEEVHQLSVETQHAPQTVNHQDGALVGKVLGGRRGEQEEGKVSHGS